MNTLHLSNQFLEQDQKDLNNFEIQLDKPIFGLKRLKVRNVFFKKSPYIIEEGNLFWWENEAAEAYLINVAPGSYTGEELAAAITDEINSKCTPPEEYIVSYNTVNYDPFKFQINKIGGAVFDFYINFIDPNNIPAYNVMILGFDRDLYFSQVAQITSVHPINFENLFDFGFFSIEQINVIDYVQLNTESHGNYQPSTLFRIKDNDRINETISPPWIYLQNSQCLKSFKIAFIFFKGGIMYELPTTNAEWYVVIDYETKLTIENEINNEKNLF